MYSYALILVKAFRYRTAQNFGGFETARKSVEKILAADHTADSIFSVYDHIKDHILIIVLYLSSQPLADC